MGIQTEVIVYQVEAISIMLYVNVHFLYFKYSINKKNIILWKKKQK
jgi:hypothetical protein